MKKEISYKNGLRTIKPANPSEAYLYDELEKHGWTATKSGWPDFFCIKDDEIMLIEVKKNGGQNLKINQKKILRCLCKYGIPCYRWSPDVGFEKIII